MLHAVDVLDALHASPRPLGVSDLARRTGLSKSTVHKILVTLRSRRLVEQDPGTARWRIGWRLYEFGAGLTGDSDLARCARLSLDQLAEETGETALLGVLADDEVLYLDKSDAHGPVPMVTRPGRRSPLHSSASGKVLLAFAEHTVVDRVLGGRLVQRTPRTVTDPERLLAMLERVRDEQFAKAEGENEVALTSVSVPVHGPGGRVLGAMTVAGPSARFGAARIRRFTRCLRAAAAATTELLCPDPVPPARATEPA
ncbi:IclR family transcriptional regulator [Pseudonocardia sp. RS11V-5]|uniref:IclR family transcriptional regulator n=1 Tax=Pseudonocardia terrae TaxID=2905831 RepID=UPI001E2F364D|nr:IclR family transcriptional regulator [Pseudonocardia terrae]MCE3551397.1 IclR family transcriptional regulator [Pseudonocardia terrae]